MWVIGSSRLLFDRSLELATSELFYPRDSNHWTITPSIIVIIVLEMNEQIFGVLD